MNIYYYITSPESPVTDDLADGIDPRDPVIYMKTDKSSIKKSGVITIVDKVLDLYGGLIPTKADLANTVQDYFTDTEQFSIENVGIVSSMEKDVCIKFIKKLYQNTMKKVDKASKEYADLSNACDLDDEFYHMGVIPSTDDDGDENENPPADERKEVDGEKIGGNNNNDTDDKEETVDEEGEVGEKSNKRGASMALDEDDGGESKKPKMSNMGTNNKTEEDVIDMIQLMGKATEYEGFSAEKIRQKMIGNSKTSFVLYKTLAVAFVAYSRVGNNTGKLTKKRTDVKISLELVNKISEMGVVMKADKSDSLTLPRLAIAFMPEYLAFRKSGLIRLENQTGVTLDVVYQDLCFAGCDIINNKKGYSDYYDDFSKKISNNGKGIGDDEKEEKKFKIDLMKWKAVSEKGYRSDEKVMNRMGEADKINGRDSFEEFMMEALDYYVAEV